MDRDYADAHYSSAFLISRFDAHSLVLKSLAEVRNTPTSLTCRRSFRATFLFCYTLAHKMLLILPDKLSCRSNNGDKPFSTKEIDVTQHC